MATISAVCLGQPTYAQMAFTFSKQFVVAHGQSVNLGPNLQINIKCQFLPYSSMQVVRPPVGGSLSLTRAPEIVDFGAASAINPSARCNGRKVLGIAYVYHASPDFTGVDQFEVDLTTHNGTVKRLVYRVEVR